MGEHTENLKRSILSNRFVYRLRRDATIDSAAFDELVALWSELARDWRQRTEVDKELAGSIHSTTVIVAGASDRFSKSGATEQAEQTGHMLAELYRLADECFSAAS